MADPESNSGRRRDGNWALNQAQNTSMGECLNPESSSTRQAHSTDNDLKSKKKAQEKILSLFRIKTLASEKRCIATGRTTGQGNMRASAACAVQAGVDKNNVVSPWMAAAKLT